MLRKFERKDAWKNNYNRSPEKAERIKLKQITLWRSLGYLSLLLACFIGLPEDVLAATTNSAEISFSIDTLFVLTQAFLVFWMAAGFAMLEAGMVRAKNVTSILLKNICLFAVAGFAFFLFGYNLMFEGVDGGWIGSFAFWQHNDAAALAGDVSSGISSSALWLFQMVFVATAASIVSGTLAERIRLLPFLAFVFVLTGLLYPIQGAWTWGGGWLSDLGFHDFAGSTIVHSVGGWAALTGALILGPRVDKFRKGKARLIPPSSLPLATLGTFILWLGWLGFNGGSQLAISSVEDTIAVSNIYANTMLAPIGGVLAALALTCAKYGKADLSMILNGALAGLVSITANPVTVSPFEAVAIGAVGGAIVVFAVPALERLKIDDVVGAIPVHLLAGIWGTLIAGFTHPDATLASQLIGIGAIGVFSAALSMLTWFGLRQLVKLRPSSDEEKIGLDHAELGVSAYPEFR